MPEDRYGLPLTVTSNGARDAYIDGVDRLLSANPGADEAFRRAVADTPGFALAHAGLARTYALRGDLAQARSSAASARAAAPRTSRREQQHVNVIALAIEGNPAAALAASAEHLDEYPRDAMVLAPATGVFGLIGFSGKMDREEVLYAWMHRLAPHYGDDWWFLAAYGFAAIEADRLAAGRALVERSRSINDANGNAAHIKLHAHYEAGEDAEALAFVDAWLPTYAAQGAMHGHIAWHGALAALALDQPERAHVLYEQAIHPRVATSPPLIGFTDAASFLWRATLRGHRYGIEHWRETRAYGARAFPRVGLAFADVHHALVAAMAADADGVTAILTGLHAASNEGRLSSGEVAPALASGIVAAARENWSDAIEQLEPGRAGAVRIGGSRAQRDMVELTLRHAYCAIGDHERAVGVVRMRGGPY